MTNQSARVWRDGKLLDAPSASLPVLTHSLHYGVGAFEGIRAYRQTSGGSAVFRLHEHIRRLMDSCRLVGLRPAVSDAEIRAGCLDVLRANGLQEGYLRPLVILGEGAMGLLPADNPTITLIAAWGWGAYLGEEALERGIRCKISSYCRPHANTALTRAKLTGQYILSVMAKREAQAAGYEEAILLDLSGNVAEGSGENLFLVQGDQLVTPPLGSPILAGITRASVITLAREQGLTVVERTFPRDELFFSDEVFLTGTAAELTPVREIDDRPIGGGKAGPVTKALQSRYFDVVTGRVSQHAQWRTPVA